MWHGGVQTHVDVSLLISVASSERAGLFFNLHESLFLSLQNGNLHSLRLIANLLLEKAGRHSLVVKGKFC